MLHLLYLQPPKSLTTQPCAVIQHRPLMNKPVSQHLGRLCENLYSLGLVGIKVVILANQALASAMNESWPT